MVSQLGFLHHQLLDQRSISAIKYVLLGKSSRVVSKVNILDFQPKSSQRIHRP